MRESTFLRWMALSVGGLLALAALVCWSVDPYLVFDRPRSAGFNALKPAVTTQEPMMKAYQASHASARSLVLGSSRTGIGIDPRGPAWPADWQPVYNLSVAGNSLAQNLRYLDIALARPEGQRPQRLMVGLEFESFLRRPAQPGPARVPVADGAEHLQRVAHLAGTPGVPEAGTRGLKDQGVALFTVDALKDALRTVAVNLRGQGPDLLPDGKTSEWQLRAWAQADGPAMLFEQKHQLSARQYKSPRRQLSDTPGGDIAGLADLQALFALAERHGLALVLAIQPSHASHLDLLDTLGYWDDIERWKRALTAAVAAAQARGLDVQLWDFLGYEAPFLEPVPPRANRGASMQGFWDPVHYSTALGNTLLTRMLGGPGAPADLGQRLAPDTVEARLARVRDDRAAHWRDQPVARAEARRLACQGGCPDTPPAARP